MARIAKNQLTIEPLTSEGKPAGFRLFGYFNGKKIRKKSNDLAELEALKAELENQQEVMDSAEQVRAMPRMTWLNVDQLRDAEAAIRARGNLPYPLVDFVAAAKPSMSGPAPKNAAEALAAWLTHQKDGGRFASTLKNNKREVTAFLKGTKIKFLGEATPDMVQAHIARDGLSIGSKVAMATRLKAFFNYCIKKGKWLRANPCEVSIAEMKETADRVRSKDRILTPAQCEALLSAACAFKKGRMVPYVVLATWCFMRAAEVRHTTGVNIKFNGKSTVQVWGRKRGGKFRVVNIPDNVVPLLKECMAHGLIKDGEEIFYSHYDFNRIRSNAGLVTFLPEPGVSWSRRTVESSLWKENILRHTGESYLYQKTGDIAHCTAQAGHAQEIAFKHYLQLPNEADCDKFFAITASLAKPGEDYVEGDAIAS